MDQVAAVLFRNARIFDGDSATLTPGDVRVAKSRIEQVGAGLPADGAQVIDCGGQVLMPGLIDCHVHVYIASLNLGRVVQTPFSYLAHFAARFLHESLDRGFTTLRDVGGADVGLATAIRDGLLGVTPRLFYGGRIISQTGGHGDIRPGDVNLDADHVCGCAGYHDQLCVIADGADAVRRAVREELRRGASHVKVMASGGVLSPTDPLERCQYSEGEMRAAVEEAERAGHYIATHCHPAEAVHRSAAWGVRSIEHATLIDRPTAEFVAERGAFVVPTMAILFALLAEGEKMGLPPVNMEKLRRTADHALSGLTIMKAAGVRMAYGTDLLGTLTTRQCSEFTLRGQVLPQLDILRGATSIAADLLGKRGELGCIKPGAAADLLVVKGNPFEDAAVFTADGGNLEVIMAAGRLHKQPSTAAATA